MDIAYTYWEADDGLFVGYLNVYPDHLTQGHDLAELEEMLADLYQIRQEEEKRLVIPTESPIKLYSQPLL
jgi:predicted RNase H-like HicB family nuclease